jgi:asparagine synthase (glutamine-hydrolysing)
MDRSVVEALLREHLNGRQNKRLLIWSLLNVEQYLKDTLHA